MKKPGIVCILLSLLICLAACSGGSPEGKTTTAVTEPVKPTLPTAVTETAPALTEPTEIVLTEASAESLTESPTTEPPTTEPEPEEDPERQAFYEKFRELDPEKTDEWLLSHDMLQNGYSRIYVNYSGIRDSGLDLYTKQGHRVVAIDVPNGILIIRTKLTANASPPSRSATAACLP